VHFDVADVARCDAMAEDEIAAALLRGVRHLAADGALVEHVDLPDVHAAQRVDVPSVELGGGHVGVDDAAAGRVEQDLHGAVVLEHLPVAALALA